MAFPLATDVPAISTDQMREVDRLMIERYGIELVQMMENAGRHLAALARERFLANDPRDTRVVILAGRGGNGGGAMVAARRLSTWGAQVDVVLSAPMSPAVAPIPAQQLEILRRMRVPVHNGAGQWSDPHDLIIDGMIGYSLSGDPKGTSADLIAWANDSAAPVLSLDVPSGLDATTGDAHTPTIHATATLTLALPKLGLMTSPAAFFVGELYLADISVPPSLYEELGVRLPPEPLFAESEIVRLERKPEGRGRRPVFLE